MTDDFQTIDVPGEMRDWPLTRLALRPRTYNLLRRAGVVTVGDLHGRPGVGLAFDIRGFGLGAARDLLECLGAAKAGAGGAGRKAPAGPPPTATPSALLAWLRPQVPPRALSAAIRHEADRHSLGLLAAEAGRSTARMRQLAVRGKNHARMALVASPAWEAWCGRAVATLEALAIATEAGMYGLLAAEHGWPAPAPAGEAAAMRALLAMHPAIEVLAADGIYAFCLDARAARRRLDALAALPAAALADRLAALPADLAAVAAADLALLAPRREALTASGQRQAARGRADAEAAMLGHARPTPHQLLLDLAAPAPAPPPAADAGPLRIKLLPTTLPAPEPRTGTPDPRP